MAKNTLDSETKEVKPKKTTTAKTAAKPESATATKKASTAKTTTAKKPAAKKTKAAPSDLEQHYRLIEVTAYYIAEKDGFAASPVEYWIAAELQISK